MRKRNRLETTNASNKLGNLSLETLKAKKTNKINLENNS